MTDFDYAANELANRAMRAEPGLYAIGRGLTRPTLGAGEHMGEWDAPTRVPKSPSMMEVVGQQVHGGSHLVGTPFSMQVRVNKAALHCMDLAGFGKGPITLRVNWGDWFGSGLFTWEERDDEDSTYIMEVPDGRGMAGFVATHGSLFGGRW